MALKKCAAYNWDKAIGQAGDELLASLKNLRAKAAEIQTKTDKFVKPREPIDFASYKSKLTLTKAGFDYLEKLYKEDKIPKFHAKVPALTLQKRAASSAVLKEIAIHAQEDSELLRIEIIELQPKRVTMDTSYAQMCVRYPHFARQIEAEIGMGMWCYNHDAETL